MNKQIITVEHLCKSYGKVQAVKDISFHVEEGQLFAFLGPNGAGKSTTIDTLCTFLKPESGTVLVNGCRLGKEDNKIRRSIGAVFQDGLLDRLLTVEENLTERGSLYGYRGKALKDAVNRVCRLTELDSLRKRPYGKLSGGQRRRCDIARALLHTPNILFLDEPTTGLDPQTRQHIWDMIRSLQTEMGMTIFLTTHYMEEAANADYVVIMDDGKIAAKGTPTQLKEVYTEDKMYLTCRNVQAVIDVLKTANLRYTEQKNELTVFVSDTKQAIAVLHQCKAQIERFQVIHGSMDDVFLAVTGKELRES